MYDLQQQLAKGESAETLLDKFFSETYAICRATNIQQRQGIDRFFKLRQTENIDLRAVEYKSDIRASRTGNVFIETISVLRGERVIRLGWAHTSKAEWLMYFLPDTGEIYHAEMTRVRSQLNEWEKTYPTRDIKNRDYVTRGLLVPLRVFQTLCCINLYRLGKENPTNPRKGTGNLVEYPQGAPSDFF